MADMLFHAHSGLRYAVLLAGVVALAILLAGRFGGRPFGGGARVAGQVFTGLLDLQVLLGLATLLARAYYPALMGHIALMVLALVVAHGLGVAARRAPTDTARYGRALLAVVLPLILVVGGIMAIGRAVL